LKDPAVRARIKKELAGDHPDWKTSFTIAAALRAFSSLPQKILNAQSNFGGKTLDDVAKAWKKSRKTR